MEELRQSALRDVGLREEGTSHDLRMAYLQLALPVHPDSPYSQPEKFKRITLAWDVLRHPRVALWTGQGKEEEAPPNLLGESPSIEALLEVFAQACQFLPAMVNHQTGAHLLMSVPMFLSDALLGSFKTVEVPRAIICTHCHGSIKTSTCPRCTGLGTFRQLESVGFEIPPGATTGTLVRVPLMGDSQLGKSLCGDVIIVLEEILPEGVRRRGPHLECQCPVNVHTLILGGTSWVDSPLGERAYFKIPAGSRDGAKLVIPGMGLPQRNGVGRGDLQLRLQAQIPAGIGEAQRQCFSALRVQHALQNGPGYTALGRIGIIHISPEHDISLLEETLCDLALVLEESGLTPAADVRDFGDVLPAGVIQSLVAVYRRFIGSGRMVLVGSANLTHNLSKLQVVSLFQTLTDLPEVDSGEGQGITPRALAPQYGKWQIFEIPVNFLGAESLLDDPSLSYAFAPDGSAFKAFDFRQVQMVDSFAVGKLIQIFRFAEMHGGRIAIIGIHPQVHRVLEDAGILQLFELVDLPELLPK